MSQIKLLSGGAAGSRGFCGGAGAAATPSIDNIKWIKSSDNNVRAYSDVCMSSSGQYQYVILSNGFIFRSLDFGNTWAQCAGAPSTLWTDIACSYSGQYVYAVAASAGTTGVYKSVDYGANFALVVIGGGAITNWQGCACSGDGQYVIAVPGIATVGYLCYLSTDFGAIYGQAGPGVGAGAGKAALSNDGRYQYVLKLATIYKSVNYGVNWDAGTVVGTGTAPNNVRTDQTGAYVLSINGNDNFYTSSDYGVSYINQGFRMNNTSRAAMSKDGSVQVVSATDVNNGYLFISTNYGQSWRAQGPPQNTWGIACSELGRYITRTTQSAGIGWGYIYRKFS